MATSAPSPKWGKIKRLVRILDPTNHGLSEIWAGIAQELETPRHWQVSGFHTGLQTGSFPSAGKPLAISSHTSPTSWMCTPHNWDVPALFLIQFNQTWFGEPRITLGTKIQSSSRIQFASNQSKLVPRKLDPGPSSKVGLSYHLWEKGGSLERLHS